MKLSAKIAAAAILFGVVGSGAAYAAEAMCACCKDMKEKMSCCDDMKKGDAPSPTQPAPQHQH